MSRLQSFLSDRRRIVPCALLVLSAAGAALAQTAEPRPRMLERAMTWPMCFPSNLTQEQYDAIMEQWEALSPVEAALKRAGGDRFSAQTTVWFGDGMQGPSERAQPAQLTYSFPDDGVTWGLTAVSSTGPNVLNAKLIETFGPGNLDLGREYLRHSLASWTQVSALQYREVADNNSPTDTDTARTPLRGDVRIGGLGFGTSSFLAYNAFPSNASLPLGGSDMTINTSFFDSPVPEERVLADPASNYRTLRNTVSHEHGHGLGFMHQVPCDETKLMEPFLSSAFDLQQYDDIRAANATYGDRFAGNTTAALAKDFGNLTAPVVRSVLERNLSTNGVTGPLGTNEDWFRFTLGESRTDLAIVAEPTGGSYQTGDQLIQCIGFPATVTASSAGNLNLELRDAAGVSIIASASAAGPGSLEFIVPVTLGPGEFTVRVVDVGPNPAANERVQLYDFKILLGAAPAPPVAGAGIDKRIAAEQKCFFIGDVNSHPSQPSDPPLPAAAYEWDLDGDGSFETAAAPRPMQIYPSNGDYTVSLRVAENGMTATDSIVVTVYGAVTQLSDVLPASGAQGATVPVTITGKNLRNVVSASEFTVSGSGVTVIGAPAPNALGTSVTGLSLMIDPGAAPGPRDVSILNADGSATGIGLFTIAPPANCPGNANGDTIVDFEDINAVIANWLNDYSPGTGPGDADGDGLVNFDDINEVIANWLTVCP